MREARCGEVGYAARMPRCELDKALERVEIDGFAFPLGVYPVEAMAPRAGYTVAFEPGDGGEDSDEGEWEEWPDRYVYDIVLPATRVESMWRALLAQMPSRVYPILDFIGHDAYREIDPYIGYDLMGQDRVMKANGWGQAVAGNTTRYRKRVQMFDRLVRWPIFTQTNGIMGHDIDNPKAHQR